MAREPDFLESDLHQLRQEQRFRQLPDHQDKIDFCSNDYLGLAQSDRVRQQLEDQLKTHSDYPIGATGSRLISGNSTFTEDLEQQIADFHQAETGLIFNSGYTANLALLSTLPQRGDTIIYDEYAHASIRDGIRLSWARDFKFRHNDMEDLDQKLQKAEGRPFIVIESLYSMDGDFAPLARIVEIAKQYEAHLILDEAHSTGIVGEQGEGLAVFQGVENSLLARLHTFSKAVGVHGGIVLGSETLRDYLINFARPFIYTTGLPFHTQLTVQASYDIMKEAEEERKHLRELTDYFREQARPISGYSFLASESPIQGILIPGNEAVMEKAENFQQNGFGVQAIRSPTVPKGKERIRVSLHAFNTKDEVNQLLDVLAG